MDLPSLQQYMQSQRIDAWLVYDFRNSNPTLARILPPHPKHNTSGKRFLTRRAVLCIPARGEPELLAHSIDRSAFEGAALVGGTPVKIDQYLSWQELHAWLSAHAAKKRVAVEYAPMGALPVVSIVDAGTVELLRSFGAEIVSSANLIQAAIACWSGAAYESHEWASREVGRIKDGAFALIRDRHRAGASVTEWEVHQFIHEQFRSAGLETPDGPIVGADAHGADPHFENTAENSVEIRRGDWILLDLWARRASGAPLVPSGLATGDSAIFSDITWVAFAGDKVPDRHRRVFETVKFGRDAAVKLAQSRWVVNEGVQGWELDQACRDVIVAAGYEKNIRHRTGHSLSAGPLVHGVGVNIDNLETHDTRELLPGVGFTVEPGVYIPDSADGKGFGVRLEINVWVDPQQGPRVTSCVQDEVVLV